jgi:hypothetical protein
MPGQGHGAGGIPGITPLGKKNGLTFGIAESLDASGPHSDGAWGVDEARVTMPVTIDDSVLTKAIPTLLGWARRGAGGKIQRQIPFAHPRWPWLYCAHISSVKPKGYVGQRTQGPLGLFVGAGSQLDSSAVRTELMGVWESLPYTVLKDAQAATEDLRYVDRRPGKPATELITVKGTEWVWDDAASPLNGNKVEAVVDFGIKRCCEIIQWVWHIVPVAYVSSDGGNTFTNIKACVNTLNNADVWGFTAGTLLFESADTEPQTMPIDPRLVLFGINNPGANPPRALKITVNFKKFDLGALTPSANKGWNTLRGPDNGWYNIKTASGGNQQYGTSDLRNIFKAV